MDSKTRRLIQLLLDQITNCNICNLCNNGRASPFIDFENYKGYLLIGEAPGKDEVESDTPFVGRAGDILWEIMGKFGIKREHCAIINTVNCRPLKGNNKNGKPTKEQQKACWKWKRKFTKLCDPDKILLLGGYPLDDILGVTGARKCNQSILTQQIFEDDRMRKIVCTVHPASTFYNKVDKENLESGIRTFKEE